MGSADNLNFDCLELICAYLNGNDLVPVSLVSRSFLAAVLPQLYRTLTFHLGNGKRYPKVLTAFDVINLHPHLAPHVHHIDIRIIPLVKGVLSPKFALSCRQAISRCRNLRSFICISNNLLISVLLVLQQCAALESVRLNATLTLDQGKILCSLKNLRTLALDSASWSSVDTLPQWINNTSATLTCLILNGVQELNETILKSILPNVPNIRGLHVIGCPKIEHTTVLQGLTPLPALESLSITAWDNRALPTQMPILPNLRNLTIDTHMPPPTMGHPIVMPQIWQFIFSSSRTWALQLTSLFLRSSDKVTLASPLVKDLLDVHSVTLQALYLVNCELDFEDLKSVATRCIQLERLAVKIPAKDVFDFSDALSRSRSLQILHDMTEVHTHGTQVFLSKSNVTLIMDRVPTLNKLVSYGRAWTRVKQHAWSSTQSLKVEKRKNSCPTYWFLSR